MARDGTSRTDNYPIFDNGAGGNNYIHADPHIFTDMYRFVDIGVVDRQSLALIVMIHGVADKISADMGVGTDKKSAFSPNVYIVADMYILLDGGLLKTRELLHASVNAQIGTAVVGALDKGLLFFFNEMLSALLRQLLKEGADPASKNTSDIINHIEHILLKSRHRSFLRDKSGYPQLLKIGELPHIQRGKNKTPNSEVL